MQITNQKEDKLLQRKEITFKVNFEKITPKKEDLKKEISEHLKTEPELVKIEKVHQGFGERSAKVTAFVYSDKNFMKKVEVINKKVKKKAEPKKE